MLRFKKTLVFMWYLDLLNKGVSSNIYEVKKTLESLYEFDLVKLSV